MHRCPGGLPEPWLAEGGAKVGFVAYIEESRMLTMPKGAGWKISMVTRVSVMSMVSRLSIILEGMPDEMGGHDHFLSIRNRGADGEIRGVEGAVTPMP